MAPTSLWESSLSSSSSSSSSCSNNKIVCVMDASGHIGTALVNRLLQRGYTVHAAINNRTDEYKITSRENNKLRVFHSDPLDYHSIMDALSGGCSALFYSFELPPEHPTYDELTSELEVRAAHNVLEACAQTDTIEKIVFTSSATAIVWRDQDHNYHHSGGSTDFDERSWSDINFCRKYKLWLGLSKTVAEKTAWALAMDRGVNMVSINGGLLMHPKLSTKDPYLSGAAEMFKGGIFVAVDLNFLVDAHLCAFEDPSSYGRYLCFNHLINCGKDIVKLAKMLLPSSSPHRESYGMEDDTVYQKRISNEKLSKLMVDRVQLQ